MQQGINIAGVQFRKAGKIYHFSYQDFEIKVGDHVLVETEKGATIGKVAKLGFFEVKPKEGPLLKPVLRKAAKKEISKEFRLSNEEIFDIATQKITNLIAHLKQNPKDNHSRRGLLKIVAKRRRILNYLQKKDEKRYKDLIKKLDLKK